MQFCLQCKSLYPESTQYCPVHGLRLETRDVFGTGTVVRGRYEILNSLGSGGMGDVFLVRDQKLYSGSNLRAMKVPQARVLTDQNYLRRFEDEANKAIVLNHECIVRSFHLDNTDSGTPLLLMEYVGGESLRWWMDREPKLDWGQAVAVAMQIGQALESAHAAGVVHCDIKPENVRSTRKDAPVPLKVMDFGLAKATQVLLEKMETAERVSVWGGEIVAGTLDYMSPEQAVARGQVGPPSDVYSLGVVLYEMLTGSIPYRNLTSFESARAAHQQKAPAQLSARTDLPAGLADLVSAMLEREPGRRPTAAQVVARLKALPAPAVRVRPDHTVVERHTVVEVAPGPAEGASRTTSWEKPQAETGKAPGRKVAAPVVMILIGVALVIGLDWINYARSHQGSETPSVVPASDTGNGAVAPASGQTTPTAQDGNPANSTPAANNGGVAPVVSQTGQFRISCDTACAWRFDGAGQKQLETDAAVTYSSVPAGRHVIVAEPADGSVAGEQKTVTIEAGHSAEVSFQFAAARAARSQQVNDALASADAKRKAGDDAGAAQEYNRALRLDPGNQTAKEKKDEVLKECRILGIACSG